MAAAGDDHPIPVTNGGNTNEVAGSAASDIPAKLQHWRGFRRFFGLGAAPMLEFGQKPSVAPAEASRGHVWLRVNRVSGRVNLLDCNLLRPRENRAPEDRFPTE